MNSVYPKISIILPSYNVNEFIAECIESVINQSLKDIEIICVDARSTDGTLEILKAYAENDSRIKLILSDKKSYGHQVNLGLSIAKGEYVGIVETDDYITENMYELLYNNINGGTSDIVKGNFFHLTLDESKNFNLRKDVTKSNSPDTQFTIYDNSNILNGHPSIWSAIYNRKFLEDNNIRFMEAPRGGWVDNPFFFESLCLARSIMYLDDPVYIYREFNPNSSSNNLTDLTLPLKRMLNNLNILKKHNCHDENVLKALYIRIFWHIKDILVKKEFHNQENNINIYLKSIFNRMDSNLINHLDNESKELYISYCSKFNITGIEDNPSKLSVIVVIDNLKNDFKKIMDSLFKQTLNDIEFICFDLTSSNEFYDYCNKYLGEYNIKLFSPNNFKVNDAYNCGIEVANGDYVFFLTSENSLEDSFVLEKLYCEAIKNNSNMVTGNIKQKTQCYETIDFTNYVKYFKDSELFAPENYGCPLCFDKNLYKRDFLTYNNLFFQDLNVGCDSIFLANILNKINNISAVPVDVYSDYSNLFDLDCDENKLIGYLHYFKSVFDILKESKFNQSKNRFRSLLYDFISHLPSHNIKVVWDNLNIFRADLFFLKDLENYIYLKFGSYPKLECLSEIIDNPMLSVIILSDYIVDSEKFFNSLINQSFNDVELIFIGNFNVSLNKLNQTYENIKLINSSLKMEEMLVEGYNNSSGDLCIFLNPNNDIDSNLFFNLIESTLINDNGIILNKSNIQKYYEDSCIIRNLNINNRQEKLIRNINDNSIKFPKISVIIPVYNAELFLEEALTSVLNQTFSNIELVCVNDGSKDNSLSMLIDFAKSDYRIKIIDQKNAGCGAARNKALDEANGEFIYFFDPDDYILPNTFERLYKNAIRNNSELVMFKIARFEDGHPINFNAPGFDFENVFGDVDFDNFTFNYQDIKRYVMNASFAPWTKLYRKDFLDKYNDFRFPTNIAFDDAPFHIQSLLRASTISFIPEFFYYYRFNPNSIINTSSNGIDIFRICDIVENFIKENNFYNEFKMEFDFFKITQIFNYFLSTGTEEYFEKAKKELSKLNFDNNILVPKTLLEKYDLVMNCDSFNEYVKNSYELKISELNIKYNNLLKENELLSMKLEDYEKKNFELNEEIKLLHSDNNDLNNINIFYDSKAYYFNKKYIEMVESNRRLIIHLDNILKKLSN